MEAPDLAFRHSIPIFPRAVRQAGPVDRGGLHAAGVVHRDVKRGNVILAPDGPWVPDFGIAHALDSTPDTPTGVMTGTAGRISPQGYRTGLRGRPGSARC